jgi:Zn-dependent protease/CBS domain-containing protein
MKTTGQKRARLEPARHRAPAFRWSWKLVTVTSIDVHIHGTFFLLIAFLAVSGLMAGQGATAILRSTLLILAIFTSVVLHEFGHALMARRFGVRTLDITLLPIGGIARLEKMPDKPSEQLQVALAGPAVNVVIAMLLFGLVRLFEAPAGIEILGNTSGPFLTQLMWINLFLAAFNLLPGYPMDGGRVLRALLAMRMAPERATQIAARVGQGTAVIFGVVGLFHNPLLIVIAVFIWLGAQAEHSVSTMKVALAGLSVRDGMITDFQRVLPTDSLSRAVDLTLAGFQQDFPVMDGERLLGVLTHGDVLKGLAERGKSSAVQEAMRRDFDTTNPSEPLDGALTRMRQGERRLLMVVDHEKVVGLLTVGNIGELLALEAAGHQIGESAELSPAVGLRAGAETS